MSRAYFRIAFLARQYFSTFTSHCVRSKTVPSVTRTVSDQNLDGEGAPSNIYFVHARLGGEPFAHPGVVGGELFCLLTLVVLAVQAGACRVFLHLRTGGGG